MLRAILTPLPKQLLVKNSPETHIHKFSTENCKYENQSMRISTIRTNTLMRLVGSTACMLLWSVKLEMTETEKNTKSN
jgi:hypothetical protein